MKTALSQKALNVLYRLDATKEHVESPNKLRELLLKCAEQRQVPVSFMLSKLWQCGPTRQREILKFAGLYEEEKIKCRCCGGTGFVTALK